MNRDCEIIRDLLPLYVDGSCSQSSSGFVKDHLDGCPACSGLYARLLDDSMVKSLKKEEQGVVARQSQAFRRKSFTAGTVMAGILMVPVLICLIVNLAVGHGLSWFFIVLTSLLLTASLTVVPLMMTKDRGFWTFVTFSASLVLLLGTCCLYTGGNWFFVAATASLFGLSVCFLPAVVYSDVMRGFLGRQKGLFTMAADTLLLCAMFFVIGVRDGGAFFWRISFGIAFPFVVAAWMIFAMVRYLRVSRWIKAGGIVFCVGCLLFFADILVGWVLGSSVTLPVFRPLCWNYLTVDGNIKWMLLIVGGLLGGMFAILGAVRDISKMHRSERKEKLNKALINDEKKG